MSLSVRPGVDPLLPTPELHRVLRSALEAAGAPSDASVSLTLAGDAELSALNETYMGKSGPTDVLSFPLLPPGRFPPHPGQAESLRHVSAAEAGFRLPPGEPVHLGDIVVSVERAIDQARSGRGGQGSDRAWAPQDELRLLVTHGALHLCGWDHADPIEGDAMRAMERELLGLA